MNKKVHFKLILSAAAMILIGAGCSSSPAAEESQNTPNPTQSVANTATATTANVIEVSNQQVETKTVTIDRVLSSVDGFVAVRQDLEGRPGLIIGAARVKKGENKQVLVPVKAPSVTTKLYAELHEDKGLIGVFEFSKIDPVVVENGTEVTKSFLITYPVNKSE